MNSSTLAVARQEMMMAESSDDQGRGSPPMDNYTAMLLLSFVAIAIGCLILGFDLWFRKLPLSPP